MLLNLVAILALAVLAKCSPVEVEKRGTFGVKMGAGIAWPGQAPASLAAPLTGGSLSWSWNWGTTANGLSPNFVGTVWGSISSAPAVTAEMIMGFNEPDNCSGQSCMSVATAISQYAQYFAPLRKAGHGIGTPAIAYNTDWLNQFITGCQANAACAASEPVYIPLHVYQNTPDAFKGYVLSVHNAHLDHTIWVTEFAMYNFSGIGNPTTVQQVENFMGQITTWMDAQPWIKRYSWFGAGRAQDMGGVSSVNRLQNDDGSLTTLGNKYVYNRNAY